MRAGYKQTEVGQIPEDWETKEIRQVCKLINGRGFKPHEWKRNGLPIIRIQNLNGSDEFNYYDGLYDRKLEVNEGQLLYAWSGSRGTSFGPHIWKGERGLLNYHTWKVVTDNEAISDGYFLYALRNLTASIEERAHGASALVHTQKWEMEGYQFPAPKEPAEQKAIADALSDVDALIVSLEKLIEKKRDIKTATMQQLLTGKKRLPSFGEGKGTKQTELGEIPEDWSIARLEDVCIKIQDGTHFSPKVNGGKFLYITSKNIKFGTLDISNADLIDEHQHRLIYNRCDVKKNDILLTKDGASTGNAALNYIDEEISLLSSVAFLRFDHAKFCPRFFLQSILSSEGQTRLKGQMAGNAITRLTLEKIRRFEFAIPSFDEQKAIAEVLSAMDLELEKLQKRLAKIKAVKQGMMQELLTGRTRLL